MTDYSDGRWHGWNGGECPVHPESVVEYQMAKKRSACSAGKLYWPSGVGDLEIVAFRVVKPYVEPVTYKGECWAYHYTSSQPMLSRSNVSGKRIHGKWTATHINGRLKSITWEADE